MPLAAGCCSRQSPEQQFEALRKETNQGNLDSALRQGQKAYECFAGRDLYWAWRFRIQNAQILIRRGSPADALKLLAEEIPSSLAQTDMVVRASLARALAYQYLQRSELAEKELDRAAQFAAQVKPELLGDVSLQRGILEVERKHYDQAAAAFHSALDASRRLKLPLSEASALANLGYLAMWQERYDESSDWFKLAIEKSEQSGSQSTLAKTIGNVGWNYAAVGDFVNAEITFKKAVDASQDAGLAADRAYWLNGLGDVYYQQHQYAKAAEFSEQALKLARKMDNQRTITECLYTLSEIALDTGKPDLAEKYNLEAAEIERSGKDRFGAHYSEIISGRIALGKKQFTQAETTFRNLISDPLVETALKWEAESRLAQVYAAKNEPSRAESHFLGALRTIRDAQDSIQRDEFRMSFLNSSIQFYGAYIEFLISQGRAEEALLVADQSRAQTLEHGLSLTATSKTRRPQKLAPVRPQEIARRQNATLLLYWLGKNRSFLWVITSIKTTLFPLPGRDEIEDAAAAYRRFFLDPRDPLESGGNQNGKQLYDVLVRPSGTLIRKNSRVVILPDGNLTGLNFETLIVSGSQPHYWIEDVTVTIANSLSLLAHASHDPPPKPANLLFFGDAIPATKEFPALADAGLEAASLKKYFPLDRRTFFTSAKATPSAYRASKSGQYSFIHFATHGTASLTRPLESAIILSPEGDSFKLYARDIVQHPLTAYLVTISACNGAGDRVLAGEGLVGLSWAFLRAGAHNVVAGLWEVSTASSPQIMDDLYKGISAGQDPATALRNAKLSFLHSKGVNRRPFYWAPFQLYSGS